MEWFKFYGQEYLTDPKMLSLSAVERALWLTILCLANNTEDGVIRFISEEKIMTMTNIDRLDDEWNENVGFLKKFEQLGMVKWAKEGIGVCNFIKKQESNLSGYERVKKYRERHPEKVTQENNKRRALRRKAEGFFTDKEWLDLLEKYNYSCAFCKKSEPEIHLTVDHIIPLSKGGSNNIENIQPLCKSCNSSKGNRDNFGDNDGDNDRLDKIREDKSRKEKIEKKKSSPEDVTEEVILKISQDYNLPLAFVASKADDMMNWLKANGKTYKDYPAALRNWVKRDAEKIVSAQRLPSKSFDAVPYLQEKGSHEIAT